MTPSDHHAPWRSHWRETAEPVSNGDYRVLGECENGDLWVPSRTRADWWDRRFNPWNPTHWPYYLRSRITKRIAFLSWDPE